MAEKTLLKLDNLMLHFRTAKGAVRAVDGVNFQLKHNEAVVVVGESGCGKTSLAKAILRLLPRNVVKYSGKVFLNNHDIMTYSEDEFRQNVRWTEISMVPQAAMNALNPVLRIGDQVIEPLVTHTGMAKK